MKKFLTKPIFAVPAVILIGVIIGIIVSFGSGGEAIDFVVVERGELVQEVSVTGRVEPAQSVELAFEKAGRVSAVNIAVRDTVFAGQALVRLSSADLAAQLAEAEANVKIQQAKLDELKKGTRPEEIQVQKTKVDNEKRNLMDSLRDAYTKSDDAIRNKVDQFISNPRSATPELNFTVDTSLETEIESGRTAMENLLISWNASLVGLNTGSDFNQFIAAAKNNLSQVRSYLNTITAALSTLTPNFSITQATIDGYRTDISAARTNLNTATTNLTTDETNLAFEENQLLLKEAGSTPEKILAQEAELESSQASVLNFQAQLAKTVISSPISGIVTIQDAKVGEVIAANTMVVSIISRAQFEIEANIPEADITKIKIGDIAKVTLDAYGDDVVFEVAVVAIDPAETVIDGVATYGVDFQFTSEDDRVKPGMTANIDVLTASKEDVIAVPQRAVITQNGRKFVRILGAEDEILEVDVQTGLRGSDGRIEIVSGLNGGERVIIFLPNR